MQKWEYLVNTVQQNPASKKEKGVYVWLNPERGWILLTMHLSERGKEGWELAPGSSLWWQGFVTGYIIMKRPIEGD